MGNDIARDVHSDVTMSNGFAMCTYHNDVATSLFYYICMYTCFVFYLSAT